MLFLIHRIVYLEQLLAKKPSLASTDSKSLLRLAELLDNDGDADPESRDGRVLQLLAEKSLENNDFLACYEYCARLIESSYVPIWSTCHRLAVQPEFRSNLHKKKLLAFALVHCDPEMLEDLLEKRMLVESQILYQDLSSMMYQEEEEDEEKDEGMDVDSSFDNENEFEDTVEELQPNEVVVRAKNSRSNTPTPQQPFASAALTGKEALKATSTMLSSVADVGWWTKSLKTLAGQIVLPKTGRAGSGYPSSKESSGVKKPSPMEAQGCHPFYESQIAFPLVDDTFLDFDSLRESAFDSKTELVLEEKLLRKSGLEACYTDGASIQSVEEILLRSSRRWLEADLQVGLSFLLAVVEAEAVDEFSTQGIEEAIGRLPQTRLTKLVACYFYALLVHRCVTDCAGIAGKPGTNGHEILATLLKDNPHNVIRSGIEQVKADSFAEGNSWNEICSNFKKHVDELVVFSQPPKRVEPEATEVASVKEARDGEIAASTSWENVVEEMKEDSILQASAYLLENQPHHRMMSSLSAGLGMLKAFGGGKK